MAKKTNKAKKSPKKPLKKAAKPVKKKTSSSAKKKAPSKSKKKTATRRIVRMTSDQVKLFFKYLHGVLDGSTMNVDFDKFLLGISDPANVGKAIEKSHFSMVITHNDPIKPADVSIDINRIELKDK